MTVGLPTTNVIFETRQDLIDHVIDTMDGQVTDAQVQKLIALAEARLNRLIIAPEREVVATSSFSADISLPSDLWALRSMHIDADPITVLEQMSPSALRKQYAWSVSGTPQAFALVGSSVIFGPQPDATYDLVITYQQTIPGLTDLNTSNWLLTYHPDIYLYATLVQSEVFIANDERVGLWKSALDEALAELAESSSRKRSYPSPIRLRSGVCD